MPDQSPSTPWKITRTAAASGAVLSIGAALVGPVPSAGAADATVTSTANDGAGSLREAIEQANTDAGLDEITFAPGLGPITLTDQIVIEDELTITGPASISGGGTNRIFYIDDADSVTLTGLTLQDGEVEGENGGAISSLDTNLTIQGSTITGNHALSEAGQYGAYGGAGGGLHAEDADVTILDSTFSDNVAEEEGGGVYAHLDEGPSLVISGSTFSGNTSGGEGGGLSSLHVYDVTIETTTFSGNTSEDGHGGGASLNAEGGTLAITSSTVSGNSAGDGGGGVRVYGFDYVDIAHTTIAGNDAGYGGGALIYDAGEIVFDHTILGDNAAGDYADLAIEDNDSVTVSNSLIEADGEVGPDTFDDGGGNVLGEGPALAALADNGGPNLTHALTASSPALDGGDPGFTPPPDTDQRGLPRVQGEAIDIGAFEAQPEEPVPTTPTDPTEPPAARPAQAAPDFTG